MSPCFTRASSLDIHENIARLPSLQNRKVTPGNSTLLLAFLGFSQMSLGRISRGELSGRRSYRNLTFGRKREIVYSISRFGLAGDSHQGSCLRLGRRLTTGFAGVPRCPGIQCHVAEQNITTHVQSILALKSQNDCDIV